MIHVVQRPPTLALACVVAAIALVATAASAQSPPVPAGNLHGDTWAAVQKSSRGTITVAYYYPLEGFAHRDASGKLTGLLVDMMEQFRSYLQNVRGVYVTPRLVPYSDFSVFYDDVRRGQGGVFGLAGTTINEERKKEVSFSPPFFGNVPVLVTNAAVADLTRRDRLASEFAGFTALALKGTTLAGILQRLKAESYPELKIEEYATYQEIVERLSHDTKAFTYLDLNVFWIVRKGGAPLKRHRAGDQPREDFGIVMPLGSDWQEPMDAFFAAGGGYRTSRAYRQLIIKHLGVDLKELVETGVGQ